MKIIGSITLFQLLELKNTQNLEFLEVEIIDSKENIKFSEIEIINFFQGFKKLKSLILSNENSEKNSQLSSILPEIILPNTNLKSIGFIDLDGKEIKSFFENNIKNKNLLDLEEIRIDTAKLESNDIIGLFSQFKLLKNFMKLSLNKISIIEFRYNRKKKINKPKNVFLDYIPTIFNLVENIPSIIELNLNYNFEEIEKNYFKSKKFANIANHVPKQLLIWELFENIEISNLDIYIYLNNNYQSLIELGSSDPQKKKYSGSPFSYYDNYDNNYDYDYYYYKDIDDITGAERGYWDWNND